MSRLVIVESPTKAKTISKYLGKNYHVESSFGHIRDLPKSKLGIDVANDFLPQYVIPRDKSKRVKELKKLAADAEEILFATDEDREGEAISWHLAEVLGEKPEKIKRITFHEITKRAIEHALEHPRHLDLKLVDAQQARRIVDRLVGFELSPFLWKKVGNGLSAGRVQSVAVRMVVDREREIKQFNPEEYWTIDALLRAAQNEEPFAAHLVSIDEKKLEKFSITTADAAQKIVNALTSDTWTVHSITRKQASRESLPPFTTSTLQQESNRRLGASAKATMMLAQKLYEHGLITYMRTDSVNLSKEFQDDAATYIRSTYGAEFTDGPRSFHTKSKGAQEAHEAIRPTDISMRGDALSARGADTKMAKLYDLIWQRAVASQMTAARFDQTAITVHTQGSDSKKYAFRSAGQIITFKGFLAVYPDQHKDTVLPVVTEGQRITATEIKPNQHFTEPPARYSDATLVKQLEEYGIGRPSTYAPTIATIIDRGYVERDEKRRLAPTDIAYTVTDMLVEHFPEIEDYAFTANLEQELDDIAEGEKKIAPVLHKFYDPFKKNLTEKMSSVEKIKTPDEPTDKVCDKCGKPMVIKSGRFGKFIACSGYPACKNTIPINEGTGVACPLCHEGEIVARRSRRGKLFYSCNKYPACKNAYWDRPTGDACTTCGALLVEHRKGVVQCSNKECATRAHTKKSA